MNKLHVILDERLLDSAADIFNDDADVYETLDAWFRGWLSDAEMLERFKYYRQSAVSTAEGRRDDARPGVQVDDIEAWRWRADAGEGV